MLGQNPDYKSAYVTMIDIWFSLQGKSGTSVMWSDVLHDIKMGSSDIIAFEARFIDYARRAAPGTDVNKDNRADFLRALPDHVRSKVINDDSLDTISEITIFLYKNGCFKIDDGIPNAEVMNALNATVVDLQKQVAALQTQVVNASTYQQGTGRGGGHGANNSNNNNNYYYYRNKNNNPRG